MLYRGAIMSDQEVVKLLEFYKNRNLNKEKFEPSYLIYSRTFLSFSKNESVAKNFAGSRDGAKKILFRLNNNFLDNITSSNADLKDISDIPEEEVLFFPFSSFIITNITIKENIYYIDLEYLGMYKHIINECIEEINNNP
jgi:hypothetical protein